MTGCIMILGAPNDHLGNLSLIAKSRLTQAAMELSLNPDFKILLTGGFGKHFNETNLPHWKYAKDFLIENLSVHPNSFLPDAIESTNSVEDIEKAATILRKYVFKKIILVTSAFHLERVKFIIQKARFFEEKKLVYSGAPDADLDEDLLKKLREHEEQAIDHLQKNYRG